MSPWAPGPGSHKDRIVWCRIRDENGKMHRLNFRDLWLQPS